MAGFLSLCLLASTALLLLVQLEGVAARLAHGVGCVDNMGADEPSVGIFHGKGRELSQCVRDYRQKYSRDFECGRGLRGKICVQIKDHFQSFLDDLSLCLAGPTTVAPTTTATPNPRDCKDLTLRGETGDRVSTIFPDGENAVSVRCIDNCTVMINRDSYSAGFDRTYADYAVGFGPATGDYYLGNNAIHALTSLRPYKLKVDIVRPNDTAQFAEYTTFEVGPASDRYRLTVDGYSGDAGNAMGNLNGRTFAAADDADDPNTQSIALIFGGAFWYDPQLANNFVTITGSAGSTFEIFSWGNRVEEAVKSGRLCLERN